MYPIDTYSVKDYQKKYKKFKDLGYEIYGYVKAHTQYIGKYFKFELNEDNIPIPRICYYDIETYSKNGVPTSDNPTDKITTIAFNIGEGTKVIGYKENIDVEYYKHFSSEKLMLRYFRNIVKEKVDIIIVDTE